MDGYNLAMLRRLRDRIDAALSRNNPSLDDLEEVTAVSLAIDELSVPQEGESDAVRLGRRGGLVGGKARLARLTPERRKEIAMKAARARWSNQ